MTCDGCGKLLETEHTPWGELCKECKESVEKESVNWQ